MDRVPAHDPPKSSPSTSTPPAIIPSSPPTKPLSGLDAPPKGKDITWPFSILMRPRIPLLVERPRVAGHKIPSPRPWGAQRPRPIRIPHRHFGAPRFCLVQSVALPLDGTYFFAMYSPWEFLS